MKQSHRNKKMLAIVVFVFFAAISSWFMSGEVRSHHLNRTLISAVKRGEAPVVRATLAQGADPNSCDNDDRTMTQLVSQWFARLRGKQFHSDDKAPSALFLAIDAKHKTRDVIKALLRHGADPNGRGDYHKWKDHVPTLILYAALDGDLVTIQALAEAGADVNVRDEYGRSTLNLICYYADAKTVQVLLDKGADPNIKGYRGETALLAAVDGWNAKAVKQLIEHGAERNIATSWSASKPELQKRISILLKLAGRQKAPSVKVY